MYHISKKLAGFNRSNTVEIRVKSSLNSFINTNDDMTNKTKLIVANVFALLAVVAILASTKLMGLDVSASSLATKALLFLIPQVGFIYFYVKSTSEENKKVLA